MICIILMSDILNKIACTSVYATVFNRQINGRCNRMVNVIYLTKRVFDHVLNCKRQESTDACQTEDHSNLFR